MNPTLAAALSVIGAALGVGGFLYTLSRNRSSDTSAFEHRLTVLETTVAQISRGHDTNENRVTTLETKIDLFWRSLSLDAARILHSPDPAKARQDYLLERLMADTINGDELSELVRLMVGLLDEHGAYPGDRVAASVILRVIEQHAGTSLISTARAEAATRPVRDEERAAKLPGPPAADPPA